ncbi:MAG: hypothetical protein IKI71_00415 [Lachnospiraceae bacterium]|nr:hypothetical protein [Lachnospiraceae bacterium]
MVDKLSSKSKRTTKVSTKKKALNDEVELENQDIVTEEVQKEKKPLDSRFVLTIGIVVALIVAIVVAIVVIVVKPTHNRRTVETIVTKNELKSKLNVDVKDPVSSSDVVYGIENDSIAKITYKKKVSNDKEMNFVMRASSSVEDIENSIGLDVEFAYTPIVMNVICDDGTEVPVEARVALDEKTEEMRYMKALWYDNDKYYSMVTDNLVTREDFLQEVNRAIIANHEEF